MQPPKGHHWPLESPVDYQAVFYAVDWKVKHPNDIDRLLVAITYRKASVGRDRIKTRAIVHKENLEFLSAAGHSAL